MRGGGGGVAGGGVAGGGVAGGGVVGGGVAGGGVAGGGTIGGGVAGGGTTGHSMLLMIAVQPVVSFSSPFGEQLISLHLAPAATTPGQLLHWGALIGNSTLETKQLPVQHRKE